MSKSTISTFELFQMFPDAEAALHGRQPQASMGEGMKKIDEENTFYNDPALIECRAQIDRALGGLNTLHLGPLDYNVATTVDNLLAAVHLLEEFGRMNEP